MLDRSFLSDILNTLFERSVSKRSNKDQRSINDLCIALLDTEGEVSGLSLAGSILTIYDTFEKEKKLEFFKFLNDELEINISDLQEAITTYQSDDNPQNYSAISRLSEPKRLELLRRLNQPDGATLALVKMRTDLLDVLYENPELERTDLDFQHLLRGWFNRGFLVLRQISWETPASILEKIVEYEAVHAIGDWDELRRRLYPKDRRCFAFFHPSMPNEPLIFVEVALTAKVPSSIQQLLANDREPQEAAETKVAVFYSISNCQKGLSGISFGNLLIKQVAAELRQEFSGLEKFVTLSPIPTFRKWLRSQKQTYNDNEMPTNNTKEEVVRQLAGDYLLTAKKENGLPQDPVARFHLGNGAQIYDVHANADISNKGLEQSLGAMVNYEYDLNKIEENHEQFIQNGSIATSSNLKLDALIKT